MGLTDCLDCLFNAANAEKVLRIQASTEWANGNKTGPMNIAHKVAITNVIQAAKQLLEAETTQH